MMDGATFDLARDGQRLQGQLLRVYEIMSDGGWHSLGALVHLCGGTEASISARLRDLRKRRYGGNVIDRRYVHNGLWEYRLVPRA